MRPVSTAIRGISWFSGRAKMPARSESSARLAFVCVILCVCVCVCARAAIDCHRLPCTHAHSSTRPAIRHRSVCVSACMFSDRHRPYRLSQACTRPCTHTHSSPGLTGSPGQFTVRLDGVPVTVVPAHGRGLGLRRRLRIRSCCHSGSGWFVLLHTGHPSRWAVCNRWAVCITRRVTVPAGWPGVARAG
jgi:hypothetical protein